MLDHDNQNTLILDQFSQQAEAYAAAVARNPANGLANLIEAARPVPDDQVLDVGCGTGRMTIALAPLVNRITGVDLTPAMLEQARERQASAGIANIEWQEADVVTLPFPDNSFSLVMCYSMLHHTVSPAAVLSEMRRVCVPGGRIAASDVSPARTKSSAFDAIEIVRDPSHVRALVEGELRAIGASLGMNELAVRKDELRLPVEAVLATSFPAEGMLNRLRDLYRRDAEGSVDSLGLAARIDDDVVTIAYPSTLVVWGKP